MNDFPRRLWPYTVAMVLAALACAVYFGVTQPLPTLGSLLLLCAFVLYSSQRRVMLPNGAFVAPGSLVFTTSIVVFRSEHTLLGPIVVGLVSGIYLLNVRRTTWPWIPFNAGIGGIALLAGAVAYGAVPSHMLERMPLSLVGALAAALAYSAAAFVLVLLSYAVESGRIPDGAWTEGGSLAAETIPFAFVGYFLGRLYLSLGPAVLVLIIVPILIAREMFASYTRVKESHEETVGMLIRALEQKDHYTAGHAERVANYARYMGEELNFMPARLERLRFAALMHDIGKLVVPNQILNKPGRLTIEEFAQVRLHERVGVQMLSHIDFLRPIAPTTHADAMRFDPDDADHPIEPYIVMIADAYDAMTSTRAYRKALAQEIAFKELRDKAGVQFHPDCVEALIDAIERRGEKHGAGHERHTEFLNAPDLGLGSAGLGDLAESESSRSA